LNFPPIMKTGPSRRKKKGREKGSRLKKGTWESIHGKDFREKDDLEGL